MNSLFTDLMDINLENLCGIDEAGRGPLAGPLVVAGVILKDDIDQLNDSKKLTPKKRQELYEIIKKNSKYYIYEASNKKIDKDGISKCLKEALIEIQNYFGKDINYIYDGNCNYGQNSIVTIIKADSKIKSVSAASILAKVYRDNIMLEFDKKYPEYGFKNHKGYGTKEHIEAIKKYGYCKIHRVTFKIKELEDIEQKTLF